MIGSYEGHDLSKTVAKIRVTIDGLQSLTKETIIEFSQGEECVTSLKYERLERHCLRCHRLTHEANDCPRNQHQVTYERKEVSPRKEWRTSPPRQKDNQAYHKASKVFMDFSQRQDRHERKCGERVSSKIHQREKSYTHKQYKDHPSGYHNHAHSDRRPTDFYSYRRDITNQGSSQRLDRNDLRHQLPHGSQLSNRVHAPPQWREKVHVVESNGHEISVTSHSRRPPLERKASLLLLIFPPLRKSWETFGKSQFST